MEICDTVRLAAGTEKRVLQGNRSMEDVIPDGLIDCHAHMADVSFDSDRPAVLARAKRAGVEAVISVGERLAEAAWNRVRQFY